MADLQKAATENWAQSIIDAAERASVQYLKPEFTAGQDLVALSEGMRIEDLEQYLPQPRRTREKVTLTEVVSFIDYYQLFGRDSTVIFADLANQRFKAIFDYHQPDEPAWGEHTATLVCTLSNEWKTWSAANGKAMSQVDFAAFVEMNAVDIVEPSAAQMLEIALTLQAKKSVDFKSGVRLDNGQVQLGYSETINGTAGANGQLTIPEKFKLGIRVFQGGEKYGVEAYLRYRINEGKLVFFFQLIRPERQLEDAFELVKKQVTEGCTGAPLFVTG